MNVYLKIQFDFQLKWIFLTAIQHYTSTCKQWRQSNKQHAVISAVYTVAIYATHTRTQTHAQDTIKTSVIKCKHSPGWGDKSGSAAADLLWVSRSDSAFSSAVTWPEWSCAWMWEQSDERMLTAFVCFGFLWSDYHTQRNLHVIRPQLEIS